MLFPHALEVARSAALTTAGSIVPDPCRPCRRARRSGYAQSRRPGHVAGSNRALASPLRRADTPSASVCLRAAAAPPAPRRGSGPPVVAAAAWHARCRPAREPQDREPLDRGTARRSVPGSEWKRPLTLAVEDDVPSDPRDVGLLGPAAVMAAARVERARFSRRDFGGCAGLLSSTMPTGWRRPPAERAHVLQEYP